MVMRWVPVVAAVVAVVAAGCGSDEADPSPAPLPTDSGTTPSAASLPPGTMPCPAVWEDRAILPRSYAGCADDFGKFVPSDPLACESGQKIIRYDDRFYAVPGGMIHAADAPLSEDPEYRAAVLRCRA